MDSPREEDRDALMRQWTVILAEILVASVIGCERELAYPNSTSIGPIAGALCLGALREQAPGVALSTDDDLVAVTRCLNTDALAEQKNQRAQESREGAPADQPRRRDIVVPMSSHSFDQMGARRSRLERVTEILGLAGHPAIHELHDAHCIGRLAIVCEDEFRDPEVAPADDAVNLEALRVRLRNARGLNVVPAPDALA